MTPQDCLNLVSLVEVERACFLENSNESTKKFATVERESGAPKTGRSLIVAVLAAATVGGGTAEVE